MSTTHTALVTTSAPSPAAHADIYFPVTLRPAELDGRTVPGFVAVQRQDTGEVFAFHREGYRLISNADVFPAFEDALQRSGLDLDRMTVRDSLSHGGARTVRHYRFPAYQTEVQVGDLVALQLKVVNSYDGSLAFSSLVSGHRLVCLNGMVVGDRFAQTYGRHTKGFDIAHAVSQLQQALTVFEHTVARWQHWTQRVITDADAESIFTALPQSHERLVLRLMGYWHRERRELGPTVWALFNAATYWSTHQPIRPSSQANQATVVLQREARVRTLLNSPVFQQLAA